MLLQYSESSKVCATGHYVLGILYAAYCFKLRLILLIANLIAQYKECYKNGIVPVLLTSLKTFHYHSFSSFKGHCRGPFHIYDFFFDNIESKVKLL